MKIPCQKLKILETELVEICIDRLPLTPPHETGINYGEQKLVSIILPLTPKGEQKLVLIIIIYSCIY